MTLDRLFNILTSDNPSTLLRENEEELFKLIPELKDCKNFDQHNEWHVYDVYEHILHVVDGVSNNLLIRLVALFHDVGKPSTFKQDEMGVGHFYNHWNVSKEIFEKFAREHNLDKDYSLLISKIIYYHDVRIEKMTDEEIVNMINDLGKENIDLLFEIKRSDLLAQNSKYHYLLDTYEEQKVKVKKY